MCILERDVHSAIPVVAQVRILTRILPVLFENPNDPFYVDLFWSYGAKDAAAAALGCDQEGRLGCKLVSLVYDLAFHPGFTIGVSRFLTWQTQRALRIKSQEEGQAPRPSTKSQCGQPRQAAESAAEPDVDARPEPDSDVSSDGDSEARHAAADRLAANSVEGDARPHSPPASQASSRSDARTELSGPDSRNPVEHMLPVRPVLLWEGGLAFKTVPGSGSWDANRLELLRLILAMLSEVIFRPPPQDPAVPIVRDYKPN